MTNDELGAKTDGSGHGPHRSHHPCQHRTLERRDRLNRLVWRRRPSAEWLGKGPTLLRKEAVSGSVAATGQDSRTFKRVSSERGNPTSSRLEASVSRS
jgi:hypothetical protein